MASHSPSEIRSPAVSEDNQELEAEYESMQKEIRIASAKLGIENLIDSTRDKGDEIRIWVGFGLTYPRCFILRYLNGDREASYLTLTTIHGRTDVGEKVQAKPTKTALAIPKSGWDEFERYLKSQGIQSPIQLSRETHYIPNPDGQIIAIEVRSGETYSMVFFHLDNKGADAKKALGVCRRIEEEFYIAMHCGV